jgi:hypothetical protein
MVVDQQKRNVFEIPKPESSSESGQIVSQSTPDRQWFELLDIATT